MIIDLVNKSMKYIIIIALISFVSTWAFGIYNTMITEQTINNITIKVVDLRLYLNNISNAWSTTALDFQTIIPSRQWVEIQSNILQNQFWQDLGNNIAFVFDWLYFPLNFILYILRWIAWILKLALAIIGWNIQTDINGNYYSTLAHILAWITQNLNVPYV